MSDLISRQAAYTTLTEYYHHTTEIQHKALREALERVPSAQPETHEERTETHACDCISRQAAIDALFELYEYQRDIDPTEAADLVRQGVYLAEKKIEQLPSAQPEVLACGEGELIAQSEIIRCKGCKNWNRESICDGFCSEDCMRHDEDFYCGNAERRTDEAD